MLNDTRTASLPGTRFWRLHLEQSAARTQLGYGNLAFLSSPLNTIARATAFLSAALGGSDDLAAVVDGTTHGLLYRRVGQHGTVVGPTNTNCRPYLLGPAHGGWLDAQSTIAGSSLR